MKLKFKIKAVMNWHESFPQTYSPTTKLETQNIVITATTPKSFRTTSLSSFLAPCILPPWPKASQTKRCASKAKQSAPLQPSPRVTRSSEAGQIESQSLSPSSESTSLSKGNSAAKAHSITIRKTYRMPSTTLQGLGYCPLFSVTDFSPKLPCRSQRPPTPLDPADREVRRNLSTYDWEKLWWVMHSHSWIWAYLALG